MKHANWARTLMALTVITVITLVMVPAAPAANSRSFSSNWFNWDETNIPSNAFLSVAAAEPDDVWAVGSYLPLSSGSAYHFNGTSWSNTSLPSGIASLNGVSAIDSNHVWAVGDNGVGGGRIIQFDGASWQSEATTPGYPLYGVYALPSGEAFAVGAGVIMHLWAGSWHDETPVGAGTLRSVYALDSEHVWAVGNNGVTDQIYFFNGSSWTDQSTGGAFLNSVFALDTNRVWAVGNSARSIFFDGTSWVNNPVTSLSNLSGVFALDVNHLFMSSGNSADHGTILNWDGVNWNSTDTTLNPELLSAVTATDTNHIWAVGGSKVYSGRKKPDATANTYYFAEGTCRPNFDSYICIQNPDQLAANVTITYMLGNGTVQDQPLTIPGRSRTTVRASDVLGSGDDEAHDFSARVHCTSGTNIVAERPMYFNYKGAWTGGHDVVGALNPQPTFYFAEGSCRPDFDPYLCIQNPGSTAADVQITYMRGDGSIAGEILNVPANKRSTVVVKNTLGTGDDDAHDFSAKVETTNGTSIVAERPMYFNYKGEWTGGHDVVGNSGAGQEVLLRRRQLPPGLQLLYLHPEPGR